MFSSFFTTESSTPLLSAMESSPVMLGMLLPFSLSSFRELYYLDGMGWSLKSPNVSSFGHPLVLKLSLSTITSSFILAGLQCEIQSRFYVIRVSKIALLVVVLGS